jgi:hypothetical protein
VSDIELRFSPGVRARQSIPALSMEETVCLKLIALSIRLVCYVFGLVEHRMSERSDTYLLCLPAIFPTILLSI